MSSILQLGKRGTEQVGRASAEGTARNASGLRTRRLWRDTHAWAAPCWGTDARSPPEGLPLWGAFGGAVCVAVGGPHGGAREPRGQPGDQGAQHRAWRVGGTAVAHVAGTVGARRRGCWGHRGDYSSLSGLYSKQKTLSSGAHPAPRCSNGAPTLCPVPVGLSWASPSLDAQHPACSHIHGLRDCASVSL